MQVEIFSLCDAATAESGKLNVLGAFDTLWAKELPAVHQQCAIALRLRFEESEGSVHQMVLNFVDFDGQHIMPSANGTINIQFSAEQKTASANLVLNVHMLKIQNQGEYSIDLLLDGSQAASIPLFVRNNG